MVTMSLFIQWDLKPKTGTRFYMATRSIVPMMSSATSDFHHLDWNRFYAPVFCMVFHASMALFLSIRLTTGWRQPRNGLVSKIDPLGIRRWLGVAPVY
tara:strand:- start:279 stop:572 length:294 start_codon:yes stop_codon:yes gene_type:complete